MWNVEIISGNSQGENGPANAFINIKTENMSLDTIRETIEAAPQIDELKQCLQLAYDLLQDSYTVQAFKNDPKFIRMQNALAERVKVYPAPQVIEDTMQRLTWRVQDFMNGSIYAEENNDYKINCIATITTAKHLLKGMQS